MLTRKRSGHKRRAIGWIAACLLVVGPAGPIAGPATGDLPQIELAWTAPDRSVFAVDVPITSFADFLATREAELRQESARTAELAGAALRFHADGVLSRLMLRLPDYVDWVYGWVDSYIAAFKVIGRGTKIWARADAGAPDAKPMTALSAAMREVGRAELEQRVVRPVDPGAGIEAALAHVDAVLAAEWGRVIARDQGRWRTLVAAHGQSARQAAPTARNNVTGCDAVPTSAEKPALDIAGLSASAMAAQEQLYLWRVTRPFATRLGALATRLAIGGASLTGTSIVGLGSPTTAGGAALSFAATSGVVWSLDYGLNLLDDALHRDALTGQVSVALATAWQQRVDALATAVREAVRARFAELSDCAARFPAETASLP
jgi:hypothetical protein